MDPCENCPTHDPALELSHTKFWSVHLGIDQGYLGRSFVSAIRHVGSLSDLTEPEWADLHQVIQKFETVVRDEFGADLFNWTCLMNDAFKKPNPRPHVHWHVWPRYNHPVEVAGELFVDPNFAHHYDKNHHHEISDATRQVIIDRLKPRLNAN